MKESERFANLLAECEKDPGYWKEHIRILEDEFKWARERIQGLESAMQEFRREFSEAHDNTTVCRAAYNADDKFKQLLEKNND